MNDKEVINDKAEYLRRKGLRADNNAFLWAITHNITGILGCAAPFVLLGMYGNTIRRSIPLATALILALPLNYILNGNQRSLWGYLDSNHYTYKSEKLRISK